MYWRDKFDLGRENEIEIKFPGKYGAKGEKRHGRVKATPDQIKRQNQRNRETYVRRLIMLNFVEHDLWCTLKYPAGTRFGDLGIVSKDVSKFLRSLSGKWKRREHELKYIYRIEVGKKGGVHIHILINRIDDADVLIAESWKQGRVNFVGMTEQGGVGQLAAYIVKREQEAEKQLSLFEDEDKKKLLRYSCSRNLIKPERERKVYRNRTVRNILRNGPKPSKGYYVDTDSIVTGINPFTGMSYIHYTEIKIEARGPGGSWT